MNDEWYEQLYGADDDDQSGEEFPAATPNFEPYIEFTLTKTGFYGCMAFIALLVYNNVRRGR